MYDMIMTTTRHMDLVNRLKALRGEANVRVTTIKGSVTDLKTGVLNARDYFHRDERYMCIEILNNK